MVEHLDTLHVVLSIISIFLVILVIAKKGFITSMGQKFMLKNVDVLTKSDFKRLCEERQSTCSKAVCNEIKMLKENQGSMRLDIKAIRTDTSASLSGLKNDMAENLLEVKSLIVDANNKIATVDKNVSNLEISIQKELSSISKFIGGVEQYMKNSKK